MPRHPVYDPDACSALQERHKRQNASLFHCHLACLKGGNHPSRRLLWPTRDALAATYIAKILSISSLTLRACAAASSPSPRSSAVITSL
jgi:hypothetical protein